MRTRWLPGCWLLCREGIYSPRRPETSVPCGWSSTWPSHRCVRTRRRVALCDCAAARSAAVSLSLVRGSVDFLDSQVLESFTTLRAGTYCIVSACPMKPAIATAGVMQVAQLGASNHHMDGPLGPFRSRRAIGRKMATVDVTDKNFREVTERDGIAILDFWATWCGACKAFAPVYEAALRTTRISSSARSTPRRRTSCLSHSESARYQQSRSTATRSGCSSRPGRSRGPRLTT